MAVQASNPADIATLAPNIVVFVVAFIASIAGVYQALRNLRKQEEPGKGPSTLQAGVILENVSMAMWTESNKAAAAAMAEVCKASDSLKASNYAVRDQLIENAHQMERLRDVMERKR